MYRVDLHTGASPMRRQLQALEFFAAVEQQATDAHIAQLDCNRQLELRQLDRPAAAFVGTGRKFQADLLHIQLVDAKGHAKQAAGRPVKLWRIQLDAAAILLPQQMVGAPLPAQTTLEIFDAQTWHLAQDPATARLGAKH